MDATPLSDYTDEQIASHVQHGNVERFGVLMERYTDKLTRYGKKFLAREESIEDIVQDVFISAYQNINEFDTGRSFSSWIYRIAHNAFVNGLRKQQKRPLFDVDLDTFISHDVYEHPAVSEREAKELKDMIDKGLSGLAPKYREVIILHYLEGLSYREISDILKIPIGTVGVRVKRGKETLRSIYEKMNLHHDY
jgi:RNA polymerase sigma-70 factor (ECF subfamily)